MGAGGCRGVQLSETQRGWGQVLLMVQRNPGTWSWSWSWSPQTSVLPWTHLQRQETFMEQHRRVRGSDPVLFVSFLLRAEGHQRGSASALML